MAKERGHWASRFGFILAAAGSAVGLGNIWKFPYITGENGGGWFVLIYLGCIALIGLPIMMAEVLIGRSSQLSPVGAFRKFTHGGSPWMGVGWLGVLAAFVILSYYSIVAGWAMHYTWLSISTGFTEMESDAISATFGSVYANPWINIGWHGAFMAITIAIVAKGVRGGIELASRILMPVLFILLLILLIYSTTRDGFGEAFKFIFMPDSTKLSGASVLEALGHSFFTLSLGMGAMITYGSYLHKKEDLVSASITIAFLDTAVALLACLVLFPIIFTVGMDPAAGPGLVFVSIPIAFSQMTGGALLAPLFFLLLTFAALTSAISLLEVAVSYFVDEIKIPRLVATIMTGFVIFIFGIPSALSGGTALFGSGFADMTQSIFGEGNGKNWFDLFDYLASNWMLPLGGLGIAVFVAWRMGDAAREEGFKTSSQLGKLYWWWVFLLRYIVPIGVLAVFLHAIGII
jgi:NSS family neurotransmitter:Na+ symporter|tara:strand:- start:1853 stop:3235 length:1383 start_codon:yes stop_codon:yes gene_type:complete